MSSAIVYTVDTKVKAYRAVPLSTRQIVASIVTLSVFSFFYLVYAQKHALLFYIMTGLIGVYIMFVYTSGIAAVLYMVVREYPEEDYSDEKSSMSSRSVEESQM